MAVSHGRGREEHLSFFSPLDKLSEILFFIDQRLVNEHRKTRIKERLATFNVLVSDVGSTDNGVDLAEHFKRIVNDVRDVGRLCHHFSHFALCVAGTADVSDVSTLNAEGLLGLFSEIFGNYGKERLAVFIHILLVVAVEHSTP